MGGIIPACNATALYSRIANKTVRFCTDRKGTTGGGFYGATPSHENQIVLVDDIVVTGSSIDRAMEVIDRVKGPKGAEEESKTGGAKVLGLAVGVDCMEATDAGITALEALASKYGFEAHAIVTMEEILSYIRDKHMDILSIRQIRMLANYYERHGAPGNGLSHLLGELLQKLDG